MAKSKCCSGCRLFIKTTIWKRNSHGLFDYESSEVDEYESSLVFDNLFAQTLSGELRNFEPNETSTANCNPLFKATAGTSFGDMQDGPVWAIEACTTKDVYEDPEAQLWEVSGHLGTDYKLKRGDILRIGRVLLKVKDYRCEASNLYEDRISFPKEDSTIDVKTKDDRATGAEDTCRVCFGGETGEDNPLLSLCSCTGTMKYVHYLCVKTWLHSAVEETVAAHFIAYQWKTFHCEICTLPYPCIVT